MHAQRVVGLRRGRRPAGVFGQGGAAYAAEAAAEDSTRTLCRSAGACWRPTRARTGLARSRAPSWRSRPPFLKAFSDYNDFRCVCKKQMGLDKVFYLLDPASGALTSFDAVDGAMLEEAVRLPGQRSDSLSDSLSEQSPVLECTLSEPLFPDSLMDCVLLPELSPVVGRGLSEYH